MTAGIRAAPQDRSAILTAGLGAAAAMLVISACFLGSVPLGLGDVLAALGGQENDAITGAIVREIRLPRALIAFAVGAALGLSGAALQGLLRNPLADPGVLGVSAMAALGAVIAIYFNLVLISQLALPGLAMAFALGAAALLYGLGAGRVSVATLILIGVGLSSFAGAMTALAMNLSPNPFSLSDMINWLLGSVANRSFADLALSLPFILLGAVLMVLAGPGLRALTLGEEGAFSVGADLKRTRLLVIVGSALAVGASVAVAGTIGFIGIVTPHLVRPFVAADPARLLIPSALLGGAILVAADIGVRLLPFDQELKLGVVAALFGAPAFIVIAARLRRMAP